MYHHKFALIFAQIYHQEGCSMRNLVRTILAFALLAMLPAVASAQIDVGIRGGLNLSSFGGADADDVDFGFTGTRTAVNIGAFLKRGYPCECGTHYRLWSRHGCAGSWTASDDGPTRRAAGRRGFVRLGDGFTTRDW